MTRLLGRTITITRLPFRARQRARGTQIPTYAVLRGGIDLLDQLSGRVMFRCIHTEQSQRAQPLLALSMIEHRMPILPEKRDALHKAVCPHLAFDVFTRVVRIGVISGNDADVGGFAARYSDVLSL